MIIGKTLGLNRILFVPEKKVVCGFEGWRTLI